MIKNFEFPKGAVLDVAQGNVPNSNKLRLLITMETSEQADAAYKEITEMARKGSFSMAFTTVPNLVKP